MKARFFCVLTLCALLLIWPRTARADLKADVAGRLLVRLQVCAASDADEDQRIKLIVRDAVRDAALPIVASVESPEQAFSLLGEQLDVLRSAATAAARAQGYAGSVRAQAGVMAFPARIYGDKMVPPGEYRAIRVTLGEGEGRNWWCVVYPDLCATEPATAEALKSGQGVRFYSSIVKWIRSWFEGGNVQ